MTFCKRWIPSIGLEGWKDIMSSFKLTVPQNNSKYPILLCLKYLHFCIVFHVTETPLIRTLPQKSHETFHIWMLLCSSSVQLQIFTSKEREHSDKVSNWEKKMKMQATLGTTTMTRKKILYSSLAKLGQQDMKYQVYEVLEIFNKKKLLTVEYLSPQLVSCQNPA